MRLTVLSMRGTCDRAEKSTVVQVTYYICYRGAKSKLNHRRTIGENKRVYGG